MRRGINWQRGRIVKITGDGLPDRNCGTVLARLAGARHCGGRTSNAVGDLQQLCGALANDDACRHRVAGHHAGHNVRVRNPEILEPVYSEFTVHHRRCRPAAAACGFSAGSHSRSPSDDSRFQEKRITPNLDDTVEPETAIPKQLRELWLCTFLAC